MSRLSMVRTKLTFAFAATGTTLTQKIQENGFITKMIIVTPNMTAPATSTLSIKDVDGLETYNSGAINENTTTSVGATIAAAETGSIPVDYNDTFTITLSEVAGAGGGTVQVVCFIEK